MTTSGYKTEELRTPHGPVWAVVANIVSERPYGPGGVEIKRGTKHFPSGAKVYCKSVFWGMAEQITVVGRHRGSHRYVTMTIRIEWLTNLRVDLVYSPTVIAELAPTWDGTEESKARAEELMQALLHVQTAEQRELVTMLLPSEQSDGQIEVRFTVKIRQFYRNELEPGEGMVYTFVFPNAVFRAFLFADSREQARFQWWQTEVRPPACFEHVPYDDARFMCAVKYLRERVGVESVSVRTATGADEPISLDR